MKAQTVERLVWVLIFGGLFGASLGWFLSPRGGPWGEVVIGGGLVAVAAGVVLIVVRARMEQP